jgi:hypothetical protein
VNGKGCERKRPCPNFISYPGIFLEGLRKTSQDNRCPGWDSNCWHSHYTSERLRVEIVGYWKDIQVQNVNVFKGLTSFMLQNHVWTLMDIQQVDKFEVTRLFTTFVTTAHIFSVSRDIPFHFAPPQDICLTFNLTLLYNLCLGLPTCSYFPKCTMCWFITGFLCVF